MKWLAFLIIMFILGGGSILWYTQHTTQKPTTTAQPAQLRYTDPYIDTPLTSPHTEISPSEQPRTTPQNTQRTDNAAPVTTPHTVHETIIGQIDPDPGYDRRTLEALFFDEVNRQRELRGLTPLTLRKDLARTARKYSEELAAGAQAEPGYNPRTAVVELRHFGASFGLTVVERLAYKDVYDASRAGENILSLPLDNSTYADDGTLTERSWRSTDTLVTEGVRQWMLSPAHRANILTPEYDNSGVGVFRLDNILVVTQVFITEAACGYYKGPCCEDAPACFEGYSCDTDRDDPECREE